MAPTGRPLWNLAGSRGVQAPRRQYESLQEMEMMRLGALAVVAILMLSGCGGGTQVSESGPSEPTPSESTPAGPTPREEESWGPLAVEPPQDITTAAKAAGVRVRITDECVWQVEEGEDHRTLLVWPADRTTWNDDTGTITFEGSDGAVTVTDGDRVTMGGGARTLDSFEELVASLDWVSPPAQECRTDVYWRVSDLWKEPAS